MSPLWHSPANIAYLSLIITKYQMNQIESLQTGLFFKYLSVKQHRERLRNSSRLNEGEKIKNTMLYLVLNPGAWRS